MIIYDQDSGLIISSYEHVNGVQWSPDGSQILYDSQGPPSRERSYDYGSTACIFTINSGESNCLNNIRNKHGVIGIYDYTWAPSGSQISYMYFDIQYQPSVDYSGGVCIFDLDTRNIFCPTKNIQEFENGYSPISHSWSPEGEYISITLDKSCPRCDFQDQPKSLIISADGSYYFLFGDVDNGLFPGLWRPPITD